MVREMRGGFKHMESIARHQLQRRMMVAVASVQPRSIITFFLRESVGAHGGVMPGPPQPIVMFPSFRSIRVADEASTNDIISISRSISIVHVAHDKTPHSLTRKHRGKNQIRHPQPSLSPLGRVVDIENIQSSKGAR